ncbi:MAG: cyclic nucleotide-binding domain-containing protein [Chitinivibrionales bacterium]|nr:cyclic nucleotide-binding domain-containing protein [Chitinivibrionales bacterium]
MHHHLLKLLPILKQVTIFAGLGDDNIGRIAQECDIVKVSSGELLIKEGEQGKEIMIILKGLVKVVLDIENDPLEIIKLGPGNCLGEVSVVGILNHSASVVTLEDCELMILSRRLMMDIYENDKGLFSILILNIARELARRLHHTDEILLQYGKKGCAPRSKLAT